MTWERDLRTPEILWTLPLIAITLALHLLLGATFAGAQVTGDGDLDAIAAFGLSAVLIIPLFWRYRYPRAVFAVVSAIALLQWLADIPLVPGDAAVLMALFAVCRLCDRKWALASLAVAQLGVLLVAYSWGLPSRFLMMFAFLRLAPRFERPEGLEALAEPTTLAVMLSVGLIGLGGMYANTRHRYLESLKERAIRAERERDRQATLAASAERARIARELHDVIAHNLSVMVVYAEGGRTALGAKDSGGARQAFDTIWDTGKTALAEMRRLLGVLRQGEDAGQGMTPQPGVAQIEELVDRLRTSGLNVRFDVLGVPRSMSPGYQLMLYRVVQESLTNVMKHAGPSVTCRMMLTYDDDAVTISVEDDGRGAAAPLADTDAGQGLVGMRERVSVYGGTVDALPMTGGGFLVNARVPLEGRT